MFKKRSLIIVGILCFSIACNSIIFNSVLENDFHLDIHDSSLLLRKQMKKTGIASSINLDRSETFNKWWLTKINASPAWNYTHGSSSIKIGILDDGIDYTHPNIGNVNTSLSCSFVPGLSALVPTQSHGTNMAGLITGKPSTSYPTFEGIAPNCEIVSLRILTANDALYSSNCLASAINYAGSNNIKILVLSYCLTQTEFQYNNAIASAISSYNGVIFCAAGNDYINIDNPPASGNFDRLYPSLYSSSKIVSVTSINQDDLCIANFGTTSVDLAAPGSGLWTTNLNSTITPESGTSFATPIVAGSFALLKSYYPCLSNSSLLTIITNQLSNMDVSAFNYNLLCSNYETLLPLLIETHTKSDGYLNIGDAFTSLAGHKTYTPISSTQHHISCHCTPSYDYGNENHDFELVMSLNRSDGVEYIPHYECTKCNYQTYILPF